MPRTKQAPKIDPDRIYVCWMSGSAEVDGRDVSFRQGERLRGDNPAVQGCPQFFAADGTPHGDLPSHWDTVVERTEAAEAALPDHDLRVTSLPIPSKRRSSRPSSRSGCWSAAAARRGPAAPRPHRS
jgi:hypothetical protein